MINKERGETLGESGCGNCNEETMHKYFGFVPNHMLELGPTFSWYQSQICVECGSLTPLPTTDNTMEEVEDNYIDFLAEHDIIDEEEREKWHETKTNNNGT